MLGYPPPRPQTGTPVADPPTHLPTGFGSMKGGREGLAPLQPLKRLNTPQARSWLGAAPVVQLVFKTTLSDNKHFLDMLLFRLEP